MLTRTVCNIELQRDTTPLSSVRLLDLVKLDWLSTKFWKLFSLRKIPCYSHQSIIVIDTSYHSQHLNCRIPGATFTNMVTLIRAWISNCIRYKMCDDITYPFTNLNGVTDEVWEWISNSSHTLLDMWLLIQVGMLVKEAPVVTFININNPDFVILFWDYTHI